MEAAATPIGGADLVAVARRATERNPAPTAEHRLRMMDACVRALTNRRLTSAERLRKGAQESRVNASASTSASAAATNAAMLTMPWRNADA
jgi:hypothetical protein